MNILKLIEKDGLTDMEINGHKVEGAMAYQLTKKNSDMKLNLTLDIDCEKSTIEIDGEKVGKQLAPSISETLKNAGI